MPWRSAATSDRTSCSAANVCAFSMRRRSPRSDSANRAALRQGFVVDDVNASQPDWPPSRPVQLLRRALAESRTTDVRANDAGDAALRNRQRHLLGAERPYAEIVATSWGSERNSRIRIAWRPPHPRFTRLGGDRHSSISFGEGQIPVALTARRGHWSNTPESRCRECLLQLPKPRVAAARLALRTRHQVAEVLAQFVDDGRQGRRQLLACDCDEWVDRVRDPSREDQLQGARSVWGA